MCAHEARKSPSKENTTKSPTKRYNVLAVSIYITDDDPHLPRQRCVSVQLLCSPYANASVSEMLEDYMVAERLHRYRGRKNEICFMPPINTDFWRELLKLSPTEHIISVWPHRYVVGRPDQAELGAKIQRLCDEHIDASDWFFHGRPPSLTTPPLNTWYWPEDLE